MLEFYQKTNNEKALAELYNYSPVAWQHIDLIGRYLFNNQKSGIDFSVVLANLLTKNAVLDYYSEKLLVPAYNPKFLENATTTYL